jgi:hypothetical protein
MQFAALALSAVLASAAGAPPSTPDILPAAYSGYSHPEITADNCQSKDPGHTQCFFPAKTAGRYLIEVAVTSTATGPDATQSVQIAGPNWACGQPVTTKKGDWSSGPRTLVAQCGLTVLTDAPMAVVAVYNDTNATKDPKGPVMTIHRIGWNGVVDAQLLGVGVVPQAGAAAPGPAKAPGPPKKK